MSTSLNYRDLGQEQEAAGDLAAALERYRQWLAVEPENVLAWDHALRVSLKLEHYDWAAELAQRGQQAFAGQSIFTLRLCQARYGQDRLDEAEQLVRQLIDAEPHHAYALTMAGYLAYRRGETAAARVWFVRALLFHPQLGDAINTLIIALEGADEATIFAFLEAAACACGHGLPF